MVVEGDRPLMRKRIATRSPEQFGSSSGKGVGEIESVVEVHPVSHTEAAEAPSPPPMLTFGAGSDVEQVDSRYRLTVCRGACPPAPRAALH